MNSNVNSEIMYVKYLFIIVLEIIFTPPFKISIEYINIVQIKPLIRIQSKLIIRNVNSSYNPL